MKLVVGSPGDIKSTEKILKEIGGDIDEIYLGVKVSSFGSGRDEIYDLGLDELAQIVKIASCHRVDVSIAFNAPCYSGNQFLESFLEDYHTFLTSVSTIGVKRLIITDAFLIHFTLRHFSRFKVHVSSLSYVDSPEKARYYEKMGVERIILPIDLVRNVCLLRNIRHAVGCQLEVMANLGCLYNCLYHTFHGQFHGHNSRNELSELEGDPYKMFCKEIMSKESWKIVNSSFMRPEDVSVYEEIGIEYLKLAGRELSLEWIIKSAKAYIERSKEGNLLECLTTSYSFSSSLLLDNAKLNGFIDTVGACDKMCSNCKGTSSTGGGDANRCKDWADKALTVRSCERNLC